MNEQQIDNILLSVVVPCYNEEPIIKKSIKILEDTILNDFAKLELIIVNDGSRDNSLNEIKKACTNTNVRYKIISFSRNFGHEAATTAGLNNCTGDYAVIIDADLQDPPENIIKMYQQAREQQASIVYGVRTEREGETYFKKATSKLFYRLINYLSDINMPLDTGDFRLMDRKSILAFRSLKERNKYVRGVISWIGFKQMPYYYSRAARIGGETHYSVWKLIKLAISSTIYFSKKPLILATNSGIFFVILSFLFLAYQLILKIIEPHRAIEGWTSLLTVIIFFGGFILFSIGILGIYIGNIFEEVKNRPEYIIEELSGDQS